MAHPKLKTSQLGLKISTDLKRRAESRAREEDRSLSQLVRVALTAYLKVRKVA